jgi:hypothetical protein
MCQLKNFNRAIHLHVELMQIVVSKMELALVLAFKIMLEILMKDVDQNVC